MRLAKHLAHCGLASRRAAERIVAEGRVSVEGQIVRDPARDVSGEEEIAVDGRPLGGFEQRVVYALNKPVGVLSTAADPHGRPTVLGLLQGESRRLYPVGRLDLDSSGLILLTNDGELANLLTHPRYEVEKTYLVVIEKAPAGEQALGALRSGVLLEDGRTGPAEVQTLADGRLLITIGEGRNRQVRRMCEAVGHHVTALRRVRFGPLELGDLPEGASRLLGDEEVDALRAAARSPAPL